jgi:hypothetical protein
MRQCSWWRRSGYCGEGGNSIGEGGHSGEVSDDSDRDSEVDIQERGESCSSFSSPLTFSSLALHRRFATLLVHFTTGGGRTGEDAGSESSGSGAGGVAGCGIEFSARSAQDAAAKASRGVSVLLRQRRLGRDKGSDDDGVEQL